MIEGYIGGRVVADYAKRYSFDDEQKDALHHHVKEMDELLTRMKRDKAKADAPPPPPRRVKRR